MLLGAGRLPLLAGRGKEQVAAGSGYGVRLGALGEDLLARGRLREW